MKKWLFLIGLLCLFSTSSFAQESEEEEEETEETNTENEEALSNKYVQGLYNLVPQELKDLKPKKVRERVIGQYIEAQLDDENSAMSKYLEDAHDEIERENGGEESDEEFDNAGGGQGSGFGDDISNEVDKILGESGGVIMSGIKKEIGKVLSKFLNASPAGEIVQLKKMVKEGYSKAQKIAYQDLKVDYAWQKSHTELSQPFINYYSMLDVKTQFSGFGDLQAKGLRMVNANPKLLLTAERQSFAARINAIDTEDLESNVRLLTNKGQQAVWMSEADRVKALEESLAELEGRKNAVKRINQELAITLKNRVDRQGMNADKEFFNLRSKKRPQ